MCTCANLNPWLCRRVRFEPGTHSSNGCSNATSLGLICRCVVLALDSTGNTRHSGHCNGVSQVAVTVRRRDAIPTAVVAITYSELSGARIQGRNWLEARFQFCRWIRKNIEPRKALIRSSYGYHLARFCRPTERSGSQTPARSIPHYRLSRAVCGTDTTRISRSLGIYHRRWEQRFDAMGLEVVSGVAHRKYHG